MKKYLLLFFPMWCFAQPNVPIGAIPQTPLFRSTDRIIGLTNTVAPSGRSITLANLFGSMQKLTNWMGSTNLQFLTPFNYGAVGDGVTDDTVAIQAWASALCANMYPGYLAPAPGGFYKITAPITFTNSVKIFGSGGAKVASGNPYSPSQIRQFTRNTSGLLFTVANDSLHLEDIVVTTDPALDRNYTNMSCYGIATTGGAPDMDCSLITSCMVQGFGEGYHLFSNANTKLLTSNAGNNAIGAHLAGSVPNNLSLDSCLMSYNFTNQVVWEAKGVIINCDLCANSSGAVNSRESLTVHGDLLILGSRFEDYNTVSCVYVDSGSKFVANDVYFGDFAPPNLSKYAVYTTNGAVYLLDCTYQLANSNGLSVFTDSTTAQSSVIFANEPVGEFLSVAGVGGYTNWTSLYRNARADQTGGYPGPATPASQRYPGLLSFDPGAPDGTHNSALWTWATFTTLGFNTVFPINLFQYAFDKTNLMTLATLFATNLYPAHVAFALSDYPNQSVTASLTNVTYVMNSNGVFTLPAVSSQIAGTKFVVKSIPPANNVKVTANGGSDTIDQLGSYFLNVTNQCGVFVADPGNTNWIVESYTPTNTLPISESQVTGLVADLTARQVIAANFTSISNPFTAFLATYTNNTGARATLTMLYALNLGGGASDQSTIIYTNITTKENYDFTLATPSVASVLHGVFTVQLSPLDVVECLTNLVGGGSSAAINRSFLKY